MIHRTDFFPGLGWLLPRALWENELRSKWPRSHWDHWLREERQHKGRECLYPQVLHVCLFGWLVSWEPISILETVFENKSNCPLFKIPRDFHNGIKGTFMTLDTHNKYFAGVAFNTNQSFRWNGFEIRSEMTFWIGLITLLILCDLTSILGTSMRVLSRPATKSACTRSCALLAMPHRWQIWNQFFKTRMMKMSMLWCGTLVWRYVLWAVTGEAMIMGMFPSFPSGGRWLRSNCQNVWYLARACSK